MGRFILGFFAAILIIALGFGVIWGLNQFGFVQAKSLILKTVSLYPELKDLSTSYELGKKQSAVLEGRIEELRKMEQELKLQKTNFRKEQSAFDEAKLAWERKHPDTAKPVAATVQTPPKQPIAQLTKEEESKLKQYMAIVGSMTPPKAALVIQKLPENITYLIFEQTSDRQVTKIMENLPADYVARLTQDRMKKYK